MKWNNKKCLKPPIRYIVYIWWFVHKWGYSNSWMVYGSLMKHGKSQEKMDDDWGYSYFRKPP